MSFKVLGCWANIISKYHAWNLANEVKFGHAFDQSSSVFLKELIKEWPAIDFRGRFGWIKSRYLFYKRWTKTKKNLMGSCTLIFILPVELRTRSRKVPTHLVKISTKKPMHMRFHYNATWSRQLIHFACHLTIPINAANTSVLRMQY